MNSVWLVYRTNCYDDTDVVGVCSTEEVAKAMMDVYSDGYEYDTFRIEEFEIDGIVKDNITTLNEELEECNRKTERLKNLLTRLGGA